MVLSLAALTAQAQPTSPVNGQLWPDTDGQHINAHGGNIIRHEGTWYWYGEHRPVRGFSMDAGVAAYSSSDLIHWKNVLARRTERSKTWAMLRSTSLPSSSFSPLTV